MAYEDLRHFLATLEHHRDLHRVTVEVDPQQELAEITDRVSKLPGGGPALFFERVRGSLLPVVTNMFGSTRRMCRALEVEDLDELALRLEESLGAAGSLRDVVEPFRPVGVAEHVGHTVVERDLSALPVPVNWAGDGTPSGGRFLTLPLVFTCDPSMRQRNCGMYRVEVFDGETCGIHWYRGSGGDLHHQAFLQAAEPMPVAIVLGSDPAAVLSAAMPLPEDVEEMAFAGYLRREPVRLAPCRTSGLLVPANGEIIIEGVIRPGEFRGGGDFGNHTGFYVPGGEVPVMRVTSISRRDGSIVPATVVGPPPMEDCYLAKAIERLMLPLTRRTLPEVTDLNLPMEGIFHGAAIVAISKSQAGQGRKVIEELWSGGWLRKSRLLVIVDDDVDCRDLSHSLWRVLNAADWEHDVLISDLPGRCRALPGGGRLAVDATRKLPGERGAPWPAEVQRESWVRDLVRRRWSEYAIPGTKPEDLRNS